MILFSLWLKVSLLSDGATFISSCGDWYEAPYPFFINIGTVDNGDVVASTPAVPGNVFATRGARDVATFTGQDFTTFEGQWLSAPPPPAPLPHSRLPWPLT